MRYRIAVLDSRRRAERSRTSARMRAQARFDLCGALLPVGHACSTRSRARRSTCRPAASCAGIYARNDINRAVYKAPANEVVNLAHRLRDAAEQGAAGRAQSRGHQLLPLLRGPRLPAVGRAHDQLRPRMEVRQPAALLRLSGALDRQRHAVGGLRAQRRAAVGQRPPHHRGLPAQRVADGRAAGRQAGEGVLRAAATARP